MSLCRSSDPELWFSTAASKIARAKAICEECPARAACLATALNDKIEYGTWGGMTETERRRILRPRKPQKGYPRKNHPCTEAPSEIRGVSWNASKGRWSVAIWHGGKMHWGGTHESLADAEAVAIAKCAQFGTTTERTRSGKRAA